MESFASKMKISETTYLLSEVLKISLFLFKDNYQKYSDCLSSIQYSYQKPLYSKENINYLDLSESID